MVVVGAAALGGACSGGDGPPRDAPPVVLARTGPDAAWELRGERRAGVTCLALREADVVLEERCGATATDLRTWEVSTVSYGNRVVVFAPLPANAVHVRLDGLDQSVHVVDARAADGFPGRFLLDDVDSDATPQVVRVFASHGRALVP